MNKSSMRDAQMLIHHLTIAQQKFMYLYNECEVVWIREGLNPEDAYNYGFKPIISVTLNVAKLGIYHQKLYAAHDIIPLTDFLFEAWRERDDLGGIPDVLFTDEALLEHYPLKEIIHELDPDGCIHEIVTRGDPSFAASKRHAQEESLVAIEWPRNKTITKPASREALLAVLNSNLLEYHHLGSSSDCMEKSPKLRQARLELEQRPHRIPTKPVSNFGIITNNWMMKQALSVPTMAVTQTIFEVSNSGWIQYLELGYDTDAQDNDDDSEGFNYGYPERTAGYVWHSERPGFKEFIESLPLAIDKLSDLDISTHLFKSFLSGREAIPFHQWKNLEAAFDEGGYVVFPTTLNSAGAVYNYLSYGGDVTSCIELVGPGRKCNQYRIIAANGCSRGVFVLAIKSGSRADSPKLGQYIVNFGGELDIGSAGFAALEFWLITLIKDCALSNSKTFLAMVDVMLEGFEPWNNDDPYDRFITRRVLP
jgi:hypothetical protein